MLPFLRCVGFDSEGAHRARLQHIQKIFQHFLLADNRTQPGKRSANYRDVNVQPSPSTLTLASGNSRFRRWVTLSLCICRSPGFSGNGSGAEQRSERSFGFHSRHDVVAAYELASDKQLGKCRRSGDGWQTFANERVGEYVDVAEGNSNSFESANGVSREAALGCAGVPFM